mmetsp:Transcript_662/g.2413  ORF Transcript_662/g.2413 Transcript_662/m.2413 type:complete len:103 (-) Transcript_662:99-407(-)
MSCSRHLFREQPGARDVAVVDVRSDKLGDVVQTTSRALRLSLEAKEKVVLAATATKMRAAEQPPQQQQSKRRRNEGQVTFNNSFRPPSASVRQRGAPSHRGL